MSPFELFRSEGGNAMSRTPILENDQQRSVTGLKSVVNSCFTALPLISLESVAEMHMSG